MINLTRIQNRRRTAAEWTALNEVLLAGEIGVILGTNPIQFKIGDGVTAWNALPSFAGGASTGGLTQDQLNQALTGYVQKSGTKVLSDTNFTAAEKTKLANLVNPSLTGYVQSTRKINGKDLTLDITLTKADIPDLTLVNNTPDISKPVSTFQQAAIDAGVATAVGQSVPITRTINGKTLDGNVVLAKQDFNDLNALDNTPDLSKPVSTAQQAAINQVVAGQITPATTSASPLPNINVYNIPIAGTYTNFGGIVVSAADIAAGAVQIFRDTAGGFTKLVTPFTSANLVNKTTDLTTVTIPASKNLFNKAAIPAGNRNMLLVSGTGGIASGSTTDTTDYIDISALPVGTVISLKSAVSGRGAERTAFYTQSKTFIAGSDTTTMHTTKTKTGSNMIWMRSSIRFAGIEDFQIEAAAAPTPYLPYRPIQTYLKAVAGFTLPQFLDGNGTSMLPTPAIGTMLPQPVTSKLITLEVGSYLQPSVGAGIALVVPTKGIYAYDTVAALWVFVTSLPESMIIVTEDIPPSRNIFNVATMPAANRNKSIMVGLGGFQDSSTSDTSDYIDMSAIPDGTILSMYSQKTGKGAIRSAFYNSSKTYISGTSVDGSLTSKTKNAGYAFLRVSIPYASQADFQIEASPTPTAFVAYNPGGKNLVSLNGAVVPKTQQVSSGGTTTDTAPADTTFVTSTNLLNPSMVLSPFSINKTTGAVEAAASGNSVSAKFAVKSSMAYSVWHQNAASRAVVWYDSTGAYISHTPYTTIKATFSSPANAAFVQLDYQVGGVDPKRVLFTQGKDANAWMSYAEASTLNNPAVGKTLGKNLWVFGASVSLTRTDLYEANWPNYAKAFGFAEIQNFSIAGASFRGAVTSGHNGAQQVDQAITEAHNAPDYVMFDLGTNDGLLNLGDYQTAISKIEFMTDLTDLSVFDLTKTYEAMLYCFYKIRFLYPKAKIYCTTFYKKAKPVELAGWRAKPLIDGIKSICRYASVLIIDQYEKLPVLSIFEIDGSAGRYLRDGQHPNADGMKLEADFYAAEILGTGGSSTTTINATGSGGSSTGGGTTTVTGITQDQLDQGLSTKMGVTATSPLKPKDNWYGSRDQYNALTSYSTTIVYNITG